MRLLVIGAGPVGEAMATAWAAAGHAVERRRGRAPLPSTNRPLQPFEAVMVAVADRAIAEVAAAAVAAGAAGSTTTLLHAAGALDPDQVFAPIRPSVAAVALCHPLRAVTAGATLAGALFAVTGDGAALAAQLARDAGGHPVQLAAADLPRYHAAAALAANHTLALVAAGVALLEQLHIPRRDAEAALGDLLASAAANVARVGLPAALTGPIARGDAAVVARHLAALPPEARALYRVTARATLALARTRAGAPTVALDEIADLLDKE